MSGLVVAPQTAPYAVQSRFAPDVAQVGSDSEVMKLVTTDGEFHRRQIDRLAEEGLDVAKVAARPVDTLADRLAGFVDDRTSCVLVSSVLFDAAEIVPGLARCT